MCEGRGLPASSASLVPADHDTVSADGGYGDPTRVRRLDRPGTLLETGTVTAQLLPRNSSTRVFMARRIQPLAVLDDMPAAVYVTPSSITNGSEGGILLCSTVQNQMDGTATTTLSPKGRASRYVDQILSRALLQLEATIRRH